MKKNNIFYKILFILIASIMILFQLQGTCSADPLGDYSNPITGGDQVEQGNGNAGENSDGNSDENSDENSDVIYKQPEKNSNANDSEQSLEDMISDADEFVNKGDIQYDQTALQNFSKTFYNIMLTVGVIVAVIVGGVIGIKLMTSSVEEKAQVKQLLVPYIVGCVVVFGGFAIWKIVVTILQGI